MQSSDAQKKAAVARPVPSASDEKSRAEFVSAVAAANPADREDAMPRRVIELFTRVQNEICATLERSEGADGQKFKERRVVPNVKPGMSLPVFSGLQTSDVVRCSLSAWCLLYGAGGRGVFKITRVLEDGKVFERAGCSITTSYGAMPLSYFEGKIAADPNAPALATGQPAVFEPFRGVVDRLKQRPKTEQHTPMFSAAISLVFHPNNPHAPTVHANYRYCKFDRNGLCV